MGLTGVSGGVRVVNGTLALALALFLLGTYWPIVKTFDLHRADLGAKGEWIDGHARLITAVTPGGAADRALLQPGDVLEFDPSRHEDWVLASYRDMPEGFSGTLAVRRVDGSRGVAALAPERIAFLPNTMDRVALIVRLCALTLVMLVAALLVWTHPSVMTWSLFFGVVSGAPFRIWVPYNLAFAAGHGFDLWAYVACTWPWVIAIVPFGLSFPHHSVQGLSRWQQALGLLLCLGAIAYLIAILRPEPFVRDSDGSITTLVYSAVAAFSVLVADAALIRTYRHSSPEYRARLKWAVLGITASLLAFNISFLFVVGRSILPNALTGSAVTPHHWVASVSSVILVLSIGYAVLRQRVVDVQFAVSRTLVYGVASTIVVVFLALLHWLLGRQIEHSGLAFGLEGLAAVGLGFVLHRASHSINATVDRVLFRKHHAAEERLRRVTVALPYATEERSIAEALVLEPVRSLELASAALFLREPGEGPLRRVHAHGWSDEHVITLEADGFLVRYLQAEHAALRLDEGQQSLPARIPEGTAHPVLAIPIVSRHVLNAVVLYGSHVNGTLPDPDEVVLLDALAKAAALAHQQVQFATLARDKAALAEKVSTLSGALQAQQKVIERFETTLGRGVQHVQP